ncbi:MAG: PDZ domain-containing protein [Verrucomicrobiota bacterium]
MKRALAITFLFIGLNVVIFWITSLELGEAEVVEEDPLSGPAADPEELLEEPTPPTITDEEPTRTSRPLLLTSQTETRERLVEEIQQGAAKAIASMVRVMIFWQRSDGSWQQDSVNAVCVDGDGLYATSWARVSRGEVFRIQHQDGSFSEAAIYSFDPSKGIALLKSANPGRSKPAVFANGLSVPFGTALQFIWLDTSNQPQALRGHLSGVRYDSLSSFPDVISGYLQPDIRVNVRQEGGMLIDMEGRMAGLLIDAPDPAASESTAILSVEDILHVCRHLKQLGYVVRSEFGIFTQKLNPDLARGLGWEGVNSGVLVTRVERGLPADRAGIQVGDLIVELNGRKVMGAGFFQSVLSRWPEQKPLVLGVRRGEEISQMELTGVTLPELGPYENSETGEETLEPLSIDGPALVGKRRKVMVAGSQDEFLVVEQIDPRRLLFSPPLESGDIVIRVADVEVTAPQPADSELGPEQESASPPVSEEELLTAENLELRILAAERTVMLCYRNGRYFWTSGWPVSSSVVLGY